MNNNISTSECYCGLRLVKIICDNIVEHGDVPKRIWQFAARISDNVKALELQPSGADYDAMGALIVSGFIPTFVKSPKEDVSSAIIELLEIRGTAAE